MRYLFAVLAGLLMCGLLASDADAFGRHRCGGRALFRHRVVVRATYYVSGRLVTAGCQSCQMPPPASAQKAAPKAPPTTGGKK